MAEDHDKVHYQDIRDDFLQRLPKEREEVEWLVKVGAFVQHCWLAEEAARKASAKPEELNELELWDLWDGCSEGQIEDMEVKAVEKLVAYRRKKTGVELRGWATRKFQPVSWLVKGLSWSAMQTLRGFVSGIGLILLGLLFVWLAPEVVKRVRGTVDVVLPQETRPLSNGPAEPSVQTAGETSSAG